MLPDSQSAAPPKPTRLKFGTKSVIERASTQDIKGGGRIVAAAREVIRLHASEGIGVADVAMRLKISRRLLEMRFREILGVGVADEMRRVRLENVCRQLRGTNSAASTASRCATGGRAARWNLRRESCGQWFFACTTSTRHFAATDIRRMSSQEPPRRRHQARTLSRKEHFLILVLYHTFSSETYPIV